MLVFWSLVKLAKVLGKSILVSSIVRAIELSNVALVYNKFSLTFLSKYGVFYITSYNFIYL